MQRARPPYLRGLAQHAGPKALERLREAAAGTAAGGTATAGGKAGTLAGLLLGDLRHLRPLDPAVLSPLLDQVQQTGELPPAALDLLPGEGWLGGERDNSRQQT